MKKLFILALMLTSVGLTAVTAKEKKYSMYAVGFYNQENLFDTIHDAGKNDYDFLPTGSYKWNSLKYVNKLKNMARALADLGTDALPGIGCAVIGLAEVENSRALDDLTAQAPLAERGYRVCPYRRVQTRRGIDCAFLYNPQLFHKTKTFVRQYVYENGDTTHFTRPFLVMQGEMGGRTALTTIVCDWPRPWVPEG